MKWHNLHIEHYNSIGLKYSPEHKNPLRFRYTDSLCYRALTTREREIILAEDEKKPIGCLNAFLGTEDQRGLDECTIVLSHRVSHRK